jgi:hypothetical protein
VNPSIIDRFAETVIMLLLLINRGFSSPVSTPRKMSLLLRFTGVSSVDEYSERVKSLGCKVLLPKRTVPDRRYFSLPGYREK